MTETLHFAYDATPPDLESLDVKAVHPAGLLGTPGAFVVVGSSHYVGLPELGYHEVCSCEDLRGDTVRSVSLESGVERSFDPKFDGLRVETAVETRDLAAFPGPEAADVAYRFDPQAWTTIAVDDAGYETYHTYPEYEIALYTRTRLERVPREDSASEQSANESAGPIPTNDD